MSDAIPLPARPNLEQYKKLAKDLQHACKSGEAALHDWAVQWMASLAAGFEPDRIEHFWRGYLKRYPEAQKCRLASAQFFLARAHGFASWPIFSKHVRGLETAASGVARFEAAADAIINGDIDKLRKLLHEDPELVRARSTRDHHSTLLHYVSANGVEDFRQKTPSNIVEITRLLFESGADAEAESDAYGGRSTTLGLTATSWHPQEAGVQIPLMEVLIEHGAAINGPDGGVNGCLANGRGAAAEFLANHAARLDLEGAAGVGRLDVLEKLWPESTPEQIRNGFAWACEFGRTEVVSFLLRKGFDLATKLRHHGQTGLHWAGLGGHADTVRLLLDHHSPVDAVDEEFGGTPLGWTLYGWIGDRKKKASYYDVVAMLVRAGAKLQTDEYDEKIRADPRMAAAIGGAGLQPPDPL